MRFEPVKGTPGTWLAAMCAKCGFRIDVNREPVMADRDGNPFRAFYHAACANELMHQSGASEGGQ